MRNSHLTHAPDHFGSKVPPVRQYSPRAGEQVVVDEIAAQRSRVRMHLGEDQVDHLLPSSGGRARTVARASRARRDAWRARGDRYQAPVAHERAQHTRHVGRLVAVLDGTGLAFGLGARRERERLAEQVHVAVVTAQDEPGVDESLQGAARRARVEIGRLTYGIHVRCSQDERGEHPAAVVVGEQADELPGAERRRGHAH